MPFSALIYAICYTPFTALSPYRALRGKATGKILIAPCSSCFFFFFFCSFFFFVFFFFFLFFFHKLFHPAHFFVALVFFLCHLKPFLHIP